MCIVLEQEVLKYLNKYGKVYTKTLYKALKVKLNFQLSLNKFRDFMYNLESEGKVYREDFQSLSSWTLNSN